MWRKERFVVVGGRTWYLYNVMEYGEVFGSSWHDVMGKLTVK